MITNVRTFVWSKIPSSIWVSDIHNVVFGYPASTGSGCRIGAGKEDEHSTRVGGGAEEAIVGGGAKDGFFCPAGAKGVVCFFVFYRGVLGYERG